MQVSWRDIFLKNDLFSGAEFSYQAEMTFYPGTQHLNISQQVQGVDSLNHLRTEIHIVGHLPSIPSGAKVQFQPYKETLYYNQSGNSPPSVSLCLAPQFTPHCILVFALLVRCKTAFHCICTINIWIIPYLKFLNSVNIKFWIVKGCEPPSFLT